jgi:Flp pilus assembly pilin Flp
MRDLFLNFRKDESGASLVEYAVALIVVTIIGGAGVILLGQNAGGLAELGCQQAGFAYSAATAQAGAASAALDTATAVTDC